MLINELDDILYYKNLPKKIQFLEKRNIPLIDQLQCFISFVNEVKNPEDIIEMERICAKNPDLKFFINAYNQKTHGIFNDYF